MSVEHRCTSVLVWPAGESPSAENTLLTDPCFTPGGAQQAIGQLEPLGFSLTKVEQVYITHLHGDHFPNLPQRLRRLNSAPFPGSFSGFSLEPCPGHARDQRALVFQADKESVGQVWIVGDGILDEEWLRAWGYFWPNRYTPPEITQTWRSVAHILAHAGLIIPGHGDPIAVTAPLLAELLAAFPQAEHAGQCPDVAETLRHRLALFLK